VFDISCDGHPDKLVTF